MFIANTPFLAGFSYPVGWISCAIIEVTYYLLYWKNETIRKKEP